jgi:hypothetical protein
MLSVIDVIKSLSDLISSEYSEYKLIDYDVDEGFEKPCFFIDVEDVNTSWVASDYIKESSTLKIVFFAENRYEGFLDLLDMKNNLTVLFDDPLYITDGKTEYHCQMLTTDSDLYKQDKVLTFNIQADLIQKVERKEVKPYMENLETNIN